MFFFCIQPFFRGEPAEIRAVKSWQQHITRPFGEIPDQKILSLNMKEKQARLFFRRRDALSFVPSFTTLAPDSHKHFPRRITN